MIKLRIKALEEAAKNKPEGYLQVVLASGRVEAGFLWLADADYSALRKHFSGDLVPPAKPIGKARFASCKSCEKSRDSGFVCTRHSGCCFGRWRSQPANRCPEGKW
jgi:hypothetical protein